jgi:hypothetical protein
MTIMTVLAIMVGIIAVMRSLLFIINGYFPLYDAVVLIFTASYLTLKGVC